MKNPIINTVLLSRCDFETTLLNKFNLILDIESINMYKDNFSCNADSFNVKSPNVFTVSYKDNFKYSFNISNVNSVFYSEQYKKETQLYREFKTFISTHTFKYKNHFLF
jgi:hypothetical protein